MCASVLDDAMSLADTRCAQPVHDLEGAPVVGGLTLDELDTLGDLFRRGQERAATGVELRGSLEEVVDAAADPHLKMGFLNVFGVERHVMERRLTAVET